jgi:hypothetical protein
MFDNQHSAPASLDFSSTHEDAIGNHSQNEATAVVLWRIIPPCRCGDRFVILNKAISQKLAPPLLSKIPVSFYITTPTPPSTTPTPSTIINQPFTCHISKAQDQPECSHISAQHSPSIAHASTPDIVFGILYHYYADVNLGN